MQVRKVKLNKKSFLKGKKRLGYLDDYVTCLQGEEEKNFQNLVLFYSDNDPLTYDESNMKSGERQWVKRFILLRKMTHMS